MNQETFFVTTAIPYVNAKPHLGHALLFLYADTLARYQRSLGKQVIFSAGTDEHGGKIAEVARAAKKEPKALADEMTPEFQAALQRLGISNDRFIRTTDPNHKQRAQIIWQKLSPYIYKGAFDGWYCLGCEAYKTDQLVKDTKGVCPDHDRKYEKMQQENYLFKVSAFTKQIKQKIESAELKIVPAKRSHEVLAWLEEERDLSISRPKEQVSWGISVPGDDSQVMYVWFEALMNYITVLGYPEHQDFADYWPADIQVIGKDILRFHAIYWPAMLLGLDLPIYKTLYVHGFVTSAGAKMSKTVGNVVDPLELVEKYGQDAFRYYFLRHIPSYADGDFTFEKFETAYNSELANELGNAISRVAHMVKTYQAGVIGDISSSIHDVKPYHEALANCQFDRALDFIWEKIQELNRYLEVEQPWQLAKTDKDHLREVLAYASSALLQIADLLTPLLPTSADFIRSIFASGYIKTKPKSLFPKLAKPK